jgi:hypothetical protein
MGYIPKSLVLDALMPGALDYCADTGYVIVEELEEPDAVGSVEG